MTLQELIAEFRAQICDHIEPYFFSDEAIIRWLNEAQNQACMRGRLLLEDDNPSMCRIRLVPNRATVKLHEAMYELVRVELVQGDDAKPLSIQTREWLDKQHPNWRNDTQTVWAVIQDETTLRVVGKVEQGDMLKVEGYRLPKVMEGADDTPEIHRASHEQLIAWALYRAFLVVDADVFDPTRAAQSLTQFERYFGLLPDADLRRATRLDVPQVNDSIWV